MKTSKKHQQTFVSHRTWFTSDTHFGHRGVLGMESRPWSDIARHDDDLVHAWNSVVRPGDDVFHLGDFALNSSKERCQEVFARLKGLKHLIIGNHDGPRHIELPWATEPQVLRTIFVDRQRCVLCHYGMRTWDGIWGGAIHLYGHSHGRLPGTSRSLDVGADAWGYRPVSLTEILQRMAETPPSDQELFITSEKARREKDGSPGPENGDVE
ncbi:MULTISPECIES: metallophosphoesterase [unclassified Methylobacterium]|uniref:metallophosphoesterase n=1 Tax=unclassified Methylobacterium TaxID=2615210 RepID=UPI0011C201D3|nr:MULTISPECIES: metallophosphoesterase [unclassified Methylobacterium]QEE39922.1 metallophosphoesterase [Methylobacterium sp. WL1]TXN56588.1 metallophosphoesterase [Methylobacterium sp. WL2]